MKIEIDTDDLKSLLLLDGYAAEMVDEYLAYAKERQSDIGDEGELWSAIIMDSMSLALETYWESVRIKRKAPR